MPTFTSPSPKFISICLDLVSSSKKQFHELKSALFYCFRCRILLLDNFYQVNKNHPTTNIYERSCGAVQFSSLLNISVSVILALRTTWKSYENCDTNKSRRRPFLTNEEITLSTMSMTVSIDHRSKETICDPFFISHLLKTKFISFFYD